MSERRRWERYQIAYPLEASGEDSGSSLILQDVSLGGISFNAPESLQNKEKINLKLFLKKKMFLFTAKIVHFSGKENKFIRVGAMFLNAQEEFSGILAEEVEDIRQHIKECNLYHNREINFETAAENYLKGLPPSE